MAVIGEEIDGPIIKQIVARQTLHGSGVHKTKTTNQIKLLNSSNAFLKMASGVSLSEEKAKEIGFSESEKGMRIPSNYVLFNGTSTYTGKQKQSFVDGSYEKSDFGLIPMAGIKKFNVKNLNRGSIKKATVNFTVHSKEQFDIVDALYLRLGYTVLIEWGNSSYTTNGTDYNTMGSTVINTSTRDGGFFDPRSTYDTIIARIQNLRSSKYSGNYDGLLGKISNFDWTFQPDGSYEINITVISIGDVIESLKINLPISPDVLKIQKFYEDRGEGSNFQGMNKSQIHAMFWAVKLLNRKSTDGKTPIPAFPGSDRWIGKTCLLSGPGLSPKKHTYTWNYYGYGYDPNNLGNDSQGYNYYWVNRNYSYTFSQEQVDNGEVATYRNKRKWNALYQRGLDSTDPPEDVKDWANKHWKKVKSSQIFYQSDPVEGAGSIPNPSSYFAEKDFFKTLHGSSPAFYIRFGALLSYLETNVIPTYTNTLSDPVPIIKIDSTPSSNFFFMMPNQVSLSPGKVWLNSTAGYPLDFKDYDGVNHKKGNRNFATNNIIAPVNSLDYSEEVDVLDKDGNKTGTQTLKIPNSSVNKGLTMNIYLNFHMVMDVLSENTDDEGNVSLYKFIQGICKNLNVVLGGVNNLEPSLDEENNTLRIIDTTPIPGEIPLFPTPYYKLNLFGYNKTHTQSNFIRKLNIKTAITPEFATMVTVGATAGGYTKGVEATAFSKWNKGIVDRFKEQITSPAQDTKEAEANRFPDAVQSYFDKYLFNSTKSILCCKDNTPYNLNEGRYYWGNSIEKSIEETNISVVTNFYEYAIAKHSERRNGGTTSTVGFIPFKISLTMDGLSGIKIYNILRIDSSFLPKSYGDSLEFIVTAVNHSISNNDWQTEIELTVMPKAGDIELGAIENYDYIFEAVNPNIQNFFNSVTQTINDLRNTFNNVLSAPTDNSSSTVVRDPEGAKGTIGTMGIKPKSELAPKALDKAGIDTIVSNSGTTDELRKRIVTILASYVGNNELKSKLQNQGWHDIKMENKLKKPHVTEKGWGWYQPQPWCAWFVSRVMYEAHVAGNALVSPASDKYKSIWKDKYNDGAKNSPFSAGVSTTLNYFRDKLSRHITSSQAKKDPSLIQPGDIAYWGGGTSHIGIVVKVNAPGGKLTSLDIISGNTGQADVRDGGRTDKATVRISSLKGFSQIFTS